MIYYAEPSFGGYKYVYQYKDHLGNIRLSYQDIDGNGSIASSEILEENNYYPFGMKYKGGYHNIVNLTNLALKYKFGGKEPKDDNIRGDKLDRYDFGARNYDLVIGSGPLAEMMRGHPC